MELKKFLQLLFRNRYTLVIVPAITVIITYFLVRNLPDVYTAQAQIATGIVDDSQVSNVFDSGVVQDARANQEFSNLIELMKLKKIIDLVSYSLIIHDLESSKPFRNPGNAITSLSASKKKDVLNAFKKQYQLQQSLNLLDAEQKKLDDLLHSVKYHESDLRKALNIYRVGESDFIYVQFDSEDPLLSAFVVNVLAKDFSTYYSSLLKENQTKSVIYLDRLMKEKFKAMNDKVIGLRDYKIKNGVLNISEQSSSIYAQMMAFETKKKEAEKDVISLTGAIKNIDQKFSPTDRKYLESTLTKPNQEVLVTKEKLRRLLDQQVQNDFDEWYNHSIDSLKNVLTAQINKINDGYVINPLNTAQNLVDQKITLEIQLDIARYSVKSLGDAVNTLSGQFAALVPNEAVVQSYDRDIEVASKEYLDILNKYNQLNMESGFSGKLRLVQEAMPGTAQPSKKMLLVIISGIISFVFCTLILFIIFYLDESVQNARDLANRTQLPVLGDLNMVNLSNCNMKQLWNTKKLDPEMQLFKDQLRSIRLEVNKDLNIKSKKCKILVVNSLSESEGKTVTVLGLAYAFAVTNLRVLIIDGNFNNPAITRIMSNPSYFEDYLSTGRLGSDLSTEANVFALGNKGEDSSLEELSDFNNVEERLNYLRSHIDLIIVETPILMNIDKSREWITYADHVITVFENNQTITDDKKKHVQYLKSLDKKFTGWVLNKVEPKRGQQKANS